MSVAKKIRNLEANIIFYFLKIKNYYYYFSSKINSINEHMWAAYGVLKSYKSIQIFMALFMIIEKKKYS